MNATQPSPLELSKIFMPYAATRIETIEKSKVPFVHYTSAENALKIIREKQVYMRSTVCMNDYREFNHGLDYLIEFFQDTDAKKWFVDAVDAISPNLARDSVTLFDQWLPHNRMNVYVACLSEHDPREDQFGRLSMWRAYSRSGSVGIAMVINSEPFFQSSDVFKTFGSPVAYLTKEEFRSEFSIVIKNIAENTNVLKSMPRNDLIGAIFNALLFAAASLKHPGFAEEREWRLIHLPKMSPSTALEKAVETVNGVPQVVYKIPLKDRPDDGLVNIEVHRLLKKIIIGPSNFPYPLYEAFVSELQAAGVSNAGDKVVISDIPLRS